MEGLGAGGILRLISELKHFGAYDYIILDMDLSLDRVMLPVYRAADKIVMVGDHSEESSAKADRTLYALRVLDGKSDMPLINRICLIYNRVCSETETDVSDQNIQVLGSIGIHKSETTGKIPNNRNIIEHLAAMELLDKIL